MDATQFGIIKAKYSLKIRGVIQAGAHHGEEDAIWLEHGINPRIYFEPVAANFEKLKKLNTGATCVRAALGNINGTLEMFIETDNGGQSCSILRPVLHLTERPDIHFSGLETVFVRRLDDCAKWNLPGYGSLGSAACNFLFMDVQGYEMEVLFGAVKTLAAIDYIWTEVNRAEVFEGCARIEVLDIFLRGLGFVRMETHWHGNLWGDAFYIRKDKRP